MTPSDVLPTDLTLPDLNPAASSAEAIYPALDCEFLRTLAAGVDQPGASFAALHRLSDALIGVRLFTLMSVNHAAGQVCRLYSSHPECYPVSGTRPIDSTAWTAQVLERHRVFVANDLQAIAHVFDDHALIGSLGCGSLISVPVVVAGQVLGTVNCLHQAGHYTPGHVDRARRLALPAAVCCLLARQG